LPTFFHNPCNQLHKLPTFFHNPCNWNFMSCSLSSTTLAIEISWVVHFLPQPFQLKFHELPTFFHNPYNWNFMSCPLSLTILAIEFHLLSATKLWSHWVAQFHKHSF
jgi:hypothetical protein